ncbi:MAG TPA: virulence-associated E family protein, partial [Sphingomicrobium sp.]|nr:virulence-associated E family protein [Sphingomicrobium sp.]
IVKSYLEKNFQVTFWPQIGDIKGPKEKDWPHHPKTLADWREGLRVGLITGVEVAPDKFLHDIDIDWEPGSLIAQSLLPPTGFVFGRASKRISHCFYVAPEALASFKYEDIDKTCLIELRGTKVNGEIGLQTMAPPSVWTKGTKQEMLAFVRQDDPAFVDAALLKQRVCLAAIAMILAKHLGTNGFGHEPRLAWAGFLLRAGISIDELIMMGEAISRHCNNREVADVRRAVESTAASLQHEGKKVKGGPALAKLLGKGGKLVIARINEWLGRDSDFTRVEGIIVKDHQQNIRRAVELLGRELSYNSFSDKMLMDGEPLEDRQMNDMWLRIDEEHRFRPTYMFFEKVIHRIAWENPFHPVKDYLAGLTWDGVERLDTWLTACAGVEDTAYSRAVGAIVLVAAVRRIRQPGAKYDELLIIEGPQGLNKSTALRALCPRSDWFSDDLPLNTTSQRIIEATLGKWIIEASDLAGRRRAEREHLKATLSRQVDGPARLAYAHLPVERPRQFIIIGTTNSSEYFDDPSGARRFWPVTIKRFDIGKVLEIRDQLWAEASIREASGTSIRLSEALWPEATRHQEKRREIDPWEMPLRALLLAIPASSDDKRRVLTDDLWSGLNIDVNKRDRYGGVRIAEIMHRLGFKRTTVRVSNTVGSGYVTERVGLLELVDEGRTPGEDDAGEETPEIPF